MQFTLTQFMHLILFSALLTPIAVHAKPIAYVNEAPITTEDVAKEMEDIPEVLISGRQEEIQKALVERLIQKRLVMEEAEKLGILKDKAFEAQLATLKENLIFNFVLAKKLDEAITPVAMQTYYEKNSVNFTQPAIEVSHILVETKEEAESLLSKLRQGEDFTDLAKKFSRGPSAAKAGALGWVTAGEMVPTFEEAAFTLEAGQTSQAPVKTQFGWHIIKVNQKKVEYLKPFVEVEEQIQKELSTQFVQEYLQSLEKKAKIRYETEE